VETKVCTSCGETKLISSFGRDISTAGGFRGQCRKCQQRYQREIREIRKANPKPPRKPLHSTVLSSRIPLKNLERLIADLQAYNRSVVWFFGDTSITVDGVEFQIQPNWLLRDKDSVPVNAGSLIDYLDNR
jgi:hypothetical protein